MSVLTSLQRFIQKNSNDPARVTKPVIVIGCGRSGTTMLFDLLKGHPRLAPTTGHPDGEDHVGWVTHGKAIISGIYGNAETGNAGHAVGYPCCLHMTEGDVTDDMRQSMHRYYLDEVLKGRLNFRVVNKCPHLSNKVGYVHGIFPDAKIIHLIREPVAMVASWINIMALVPDLMLYWPEADYPCFWVLPRKDELKREDILQRESRLYPGGGLYRFADYWAETNASIIKQANECGAEMLTVRYEQLVADPNAALRQITDFSELEPMEKLPITIDKARNAMRRELLTLADVQEIRNRVKPVAVQFGYA
jgi:hypothetical protein